MRKKRLLKAVFSIFVIFAICFTSSLSAFAYHPVIEINSADWNIESDLTYSAVYPNHSDLFYTFDDSVYQYSELDGESYYVTECWEDDYQYIDSVAVKVPSFPSDTSMAFGEDYSYFDKVVFRYESTLYLALVYGFDKVYLNNQNYFLVDVDGYTGEVDFYEFTYPYSEWAYHSYVDYYGYSTDVQFTHNNGMVPVEIVWSTVDVYNSNHTEVIHPADSIEFEGTSYTIEYGTPISVLTGSMSFTVTSDIVSRLSFGSFAFVLDNFGFICGMADTSILNYAYTMTVRQGDENKGVTELMSYSFDSRIDDDLTINEKYIDSYFEVLDFNSDMSEDVEFIFAYTFVSTNWHLYFPGSIEFIEFESYENDMEHEQVMSAISEASDLLEGKIDTASSELASEIADAASDVVSASNSNTQILSDKIDSSTNAISDKLSEVKDGITDKLNDVKDGITEKLEDTKTGILDGIKSFFIPSDEVMDEIDDKWDELFKSRFGALYEVGQIISDFATSVKDTTGEKNTVTMPEVKVMLVDTEFVFGGYEVQIIPDKFEVLVKALKSIISIVCTLLFVNALKSKYDKLIGGNAV